MKREINIASKTGLLEIEATEIKVKGFNKLRFFFHETPGTTLIAIQYSITEFSTGLAVCKHASRKHCVEILMERLEKYGEDKFIEIGKPELEKYGLQYPVNK